MLVPTIPSGRFLILSDADLPSVVGLMLVAERWESATPRPAILPSWWRPGGDDAMPAVHRATRRQAEMLGFDVVSGELVVGEGQSMGTARSSMLLQASGLAGEMGCDQVLWGIRAAEDDPEMPVASIAREVDRAALASRLASLDHDPAPTILTPLADLADEQMVDLARDLAAPCESCWWAGLQGDPIADERARRWRAVGTLPTAGPRTA